MSIVAMGASYKSMPLEKLEHVSIPHDDLAPIVRELTGKPGIAGAVVLSTCNRVEIYADALTERIGVEALGDFFGQRADSRLLSCDADVLASQDDVLSAGSCQDVPEGFVHPPVEARNFTRRDGFYVRRGTDAIRHLFRVVCSLDSQVLGEAQILGQVKSAFDISQHEGGVSEVLTKLFKDALHLGKRVRTETSIGSDSVSLSTTAYKVARTEFPDLAQRRVLFVGTGEMACLALTYLVECGVASITATTRTFENARAFADSCGGTAVPFENRYNAIAQADVVFAMTSAPDAVIMAKPLEAARIKAGTTDRKLVLIDEAIPRDVDPACGELENVSVYNLDTLHSIVDDGLAQRMSAVGTVEQLLSAAQGDFLTWMQQQSVLPTVKEMYAKGAQTVNSEFEKAAKEFARVRGEQLSPDELAVLEAYGEAIMKKLLHGPCMRLKKESTTPESYYYTNSARYLFGLDTYPAGCTPHACDDKACLRGEPCPQGHVTAEVAGGRRNTKGDGRA